jgi:hypothetical protein
MTQDGNLDPVAAERLSHARSLLRFTASPGTFRRGNGSAFSSHLSGQDLVTLLATGHAPVFVVGVRFNVHNYVWGSHTLEFYADGTAIRPSGAAGAITPTYTLPMA